MSWEAILKDPEFQKEPYEIKAEVARNYFKEHIEPNTDFQKEDATIRTEVLQNFLGTVGQKPQPKETSAINALSPSTEPVPKVGGFMGDVVEPTAQSAAKILPYVAAAPAALAAGGLYGLKEYTAGIKPEEVTEEYLGGDLDKLIVAGTVHNRKFSGVSTTWMKGIQPESGQHSFGLFMNDLLLDYYYIERELSWADQNSQIWDFA